MMKRYLLLIISLFFIVACSSQDEQHLHSPEPKQEQRQQAPQAAIESMDSDALQEAVEPLRSKTLKKAPIISINPDDDDMTRLD